MTARQKAAARDRQSNHYEDPNANYATFGQYPMVRGRAAWNARRIWKSQ
jgi:hypothetical protein